MRVRIGSIILTSGATVTGCSPVALNLPLSADLVLDTTAAAGRPVSVTCNLVSPPLTQSDFETGDLTWGVDASSISSEGAVSASPLNSSYAVQHTQPLQLVRKYQLGIKRIPANNTDSLQDILWAGEWGQQSGRLGERKRKGGGSGKQHEVLSMYGTDTL